MKLLIISNMAHYIKDGKVVGWGPTVQEIDSLAQFFTEIRHIGCLYSEPAPASSLPYLSDRVSLIGVPPAGGTGIIKKLGILRLFPLYARTILREVAWADVIHVRCPANISLLGVVLLALLRHPHYRWMKYAGNWQPQGKEPWSYTFQRRWLQKGFHRGVVTVNGHWQNQPRFVYFFLNPSLSLSDIQTGTEAASGKELCPPYRFLYVGRLESEKGVGRIFSIARELQQKAIPFIIDLVGDGPERQSFESWVRNHELESNVNFYGWLPKPELADFYCRAYIFLFPSSASEGWPKVLSEAMAFGTVPVAGAVSSIPQILADTGAGVALPPRDVDAFMDAILDYITHPDKWKAASLAGARSAGRFTYQAYLQSVKQMFWDAWGIELTSESSENGKNQTTYESKAI